MESPQIWTTHEDMKTQNATPPQQSRNGVENQRIKSSYMIGVQSRFRRKYYHKTIFASLLVIILLLIIAIIVMSICMTATDDVCYSKECLRTATTFIDNMDPTANPCEDFFQFMCGNFEQQHPLPDSSTSHDWFTEKQLKVLRDLKIKLQQKPKDNEPYPVTQSKLFYKSCIDTSSIDKLDFQSLFRYLKIFNLPEIPTFLTNPDADNFQHDWIKSIVRIKRYLGADKLIGFEVFNDPKNRSVNYLAIGSPSQENDLPLVDDKLSKKMKHIRRKFSMVARVTDDDAADLEIDEDEDDIALMSYNIYMREVIHELLRKAVPSYDIDANAIQISRLIQLTVNISKNIYTFIDMAENASKIEDHDGNLSDLVYIKLRDLQREVDSEGDESSKIPLLERYMTLMLTGVPEAHFDIEDDIILTSNADMMYLKNAIRLIRETKAMHLEAFLWWSIVEELILYTTSSMRHLYHDYTKTITGVEGVQSRSSYCTTSINKLMGYAVSYLIVERNFMTETRPNVERMLSNIQSSFNNIIHHSWMDWETKEKSLRKSRRMRSLIGFPEWIVNKTELESYYKGIRIKSDTWMENIVQVLSWQFMDKLSRFRLENKLEWASSPSNVNAFHTFQSNAITIPFAILQFPFYQLGLEVLNYGSIGTVLAHELTHGFDDIGRHFDENGNKNLWWTNDTISKFLNKTECFKKQYSEYYIPEIGDYINGENTLGENIADNGGLREAFYGYNYHVKTHGKEKKLPGFETYTHEQLFFMSYGNLWCETMSVQGLKFSLDDTHCPGRIRLLGVLSNAREFHNAFNCHAGQRYHRTDDQKCILW